MKIQAEEDYIPPYINYDNAPQDRDDVEMTFYTEVYAATIRMADDTEQWDNHCYNCKETGHFWHQCTKPLKEEFQQLLNCPKQRDNELNKKGGPRAKGWLSPPASTSCSTNTRSGSHGASVNSNTKTKHPPYWNDDPHMHWLGPLECGLCHNWWVTGVVCWFDSGPTPWPSPMWRNTRWRCDLFTILPCTPRLIPISGIGGHMATLGYVIINIQVEGHT